MPAWIECPCCEDYLCTIHLMHAYDCDCPPIEEWDSDPYSDPVEEQMTNPDEVTYPDDTTCEWHGVSVSPTLGQQILEAWRWADETGGNAEWVGLDTPTQEQLRRLASKLQTRAAINERLAQRIHPAQLTAWFAEDAADCRAGAAVLLALLGQE